MSRDADNLTPRVFFIRHGETEWAKSGRQTGITDIALTDHGIHQVEATADLLVGPKKLLDPNNVVAVFASPRKRAQETLRHLFANNAISAEITTTEDIAEWNYGDYEGMTAAETRALRKKRGLDNDRPWNVWHDGCEGGESTEEVTKRLDKLIARVRNIQRSNMLGQRPADVVIVAHGLILRAFAKRWLGCPVDMSLSIMLAPGALGILTYKNNDIEEPTLHIGIAIPI
ncbi:histidine phosphatase superfamily [Podospora conica]|nr:histidine phosphatase superfamily [Schizothecium conicum]